MKNFNFRFWCPTIAWAVFPQSQHSGGLKRTPTWVVRVPKSRFPDLHFLTLSTKKKFVMKICYLGNRDMSTRTTQVGVRFSPLECWDRGKTGQTIVGHPNLKLKIFILWNLYITIYISYFSPFWSPMERKYGRYAISHDTYQNTWYEPGLVQFWGRMTQ